MQRKRNRSYLKAAKEKAKKYVDEVRSKTFCEKCGGQPIEWHHEDHPQKPHRRVSSLRSSGASIELIKAEIERCEALCRSCHMKEDKRIEELHKNKPSQPGAVLVPPKPCSDCGKLAKPLRRGMCWSCYERWRPGGRLNKEEQ